MLRPEPFVREVAGLGAVLYLAGAVVALAADDEAVDILARLIDHEKEPVRARVLGALEKRGLKGLPLVERVLHQVTTPAGKSAVGTLFSKHRVYQ